MLKVVGITHELGSIKFELRKGNRAVPSDATGVYRRFLEDVNREGSVIEVPELDDVEDFFRGVGLTYYTIIVNIPGGPDGILVNKRGDLYGVDVELRKHEIERYDDIRVPASKVTPLRLAFWPLKYYISISKSGSVYVTEYEKIIKSLVEGNVYCNGAKTMKEVKNSMFIAVPKEEWYRIG